MDKLANMQAFAAVGQTGSFAAAARKLGIANSVVSKRVRDLEDYLGAQLFVRTTRKVTLTDTGYGYLEHVLRILDDMQEVEDGLRFNTEQPSGTIRLAAPLSFGMQYLGPAIASYLGKYPAVSIRTYLSDRRVDLLEEGYDLALRAGQLEDSALIARKLAEGRRVVCASPGYFRQHGKPQHPGDLRNHNCLGYLNLADGKSWPFLIDGRKAWQPVSGSFASDNGELIHEAAREGCGIAMLPTFIIGSDLQQGILETVLEDYEEKNFPIYALYPHARHLPAKIRTFIDHMAEFLKQKF